METYLTIAELAEYIKLSEQTVRRHVLNKTVPYHKIFKAVRFRVSEIEKWIDGGGLGGAVATAEQRQGDLFVLTEAGNSGVAVKETDDGDKGSNGFVAVETVDGDEGNNGSAGAETLDDVGRNSGAVAVANADDGGVAGGRA